MWFYYLTLKTSAGAYKKPTIKFFSYISKVASLDLQAY